MVPPVEDENIISDSLTQEERDTIVEAAAKKVLKEFVNFVSTQVGPLVTISYHLYV